METEPNGLPARIGSTYQRVSRLYVEGRVEGVYNKNVEFPGLSMSKVKRYSWLPYEPSDVGLHHEDPQIFGESQWSTGSAFYLVYRVVAALYFMVILLYSILSHEYGLKWVLYYSNWAFTALCLSAVTQCLSVLRPWVARFNSSDKEELYGEPLPTLSQVTWVLYNMASGGAYLTSLMYWTVIYKGWPLNIVNVNTHIVNSVYVTLDALVTGIPVRLFHLYQMTGLVLIYGTLNMLYCLAGGTDSEGNPYIYASMDWNVDPVGALRFAFIVLFIIGPFTHFLVWLLYSLRVYIYEKQNEQYLVANDDVFHRDNVIPLRKYMQYQIQLV